MTARHPSKKLVHYLLIFLGRGGKAPLEIIWKVF